MPALRLTILLTLAFMISQAAALAQQPNTVMESYRAYLVALQHGNLAAAEAPAAAALTASQAQVGDGGRSPVLALNLARLRLALGKYREALVPASLAFQAAQTSTSGVDLVMAQLALRRAQLATGGDATGQLLKAALTAASGRADVDEDAYAGSLELGRFARDAERFDDARFAYETAIAHATGARGDPNLARGIARAALGAILIQRADHMLLNESAIREAYPILSLAMREIWPFAQQDDPSGELTPAQTAFARAMSWQMIAASNRGHLPLEPDAQIAIGGAGCEFHMVRPEPRAAARRFYPRDAIAHGQQGFVIVRAVFDEAGHVARTQVAAAVPEEIFSTAAASIVSGMEVVRDPASAEHCIMPHERFIPVSFALR